MDKMISLNRIAVSPCETFHLYGNKPLYSERFLKVLKFHEPGLAAVIAEKEAYHIDLFGRPAYKSRFLRVFGFYQNLSAVSDESGWFHIQINGKELYNIRYAWCGNYQNNACVVRDSNGNYFHIDMNGNRLYEDNYRYVGDYRDDIAVAQNSQGLYTHITKNGNYLHNKWFVDLDIFHKGFSRAKDEHGWFHINCHGEAIYPDRYEMIEAFYNGYARVRSSTGAILRIDESGEIAEKLSEPKMTEFHQLSSDIVGYWRTQTIKAAIELGVFEHLPQKLSTLSIKINVSEINTLRLLRALKELQLIYQDKDIYYPTSRGDHLSAKHPLSLRAAVSHWGEWHYAIWMNLAKSLKENKPAYTSQFNEPWFNWLDTDQEKLLNYQQAMEVYARHDYKYLSQLLRFDHENTIIDAAGGRGILLRYVLENNPRLQGILLERPSVIETIVVPDTLYERMQVKGFDLFSPWQVKADVVLFSRVLHDWDDVSSACILKNAFQALNENGRLIIIEFLLEDNSSRGGMQGLRMKIFNFP